MVSKCLVNGQVPLPYRRKNVDRMAVVNVLTVDSLPSTRKPFLHSPNQFPLCKIVPCNLKTFNRSPFQKTDRMQGSPAYRAEKNFIAALYQQTREVPYGNASTKMKRL